MTRVIGIDPSLTCTSIVSLVWDPKDPDVLKEEVYRIRTSPKNFPSTPARLERMRLQLIERLNHAELAVVEDYAYSRGGTGTHITIEWGGILRWTLWSAGVRYATIAPSTLKKYTTGHGNADKNLMLKEVWKRWNFDAKSDDDADAYSLARLGMDYMNKVDTKAFKHTISKMHFVEPWRPEEDNGTT